VIINPEHDTNRQARTMLVAARIETGDDTRSYIEIAQSLGLIVTNESTSLSAPEEQTTL